LTKVFLEFEMFLCEIFSNLVKKFQNLESISCVHWGPPYYSSLVGLLIMHATRQFLHLYLHMAELPSYYLENYGLALLTTMGGVWVIVIKAFTPSKSSLLQPTELLGTACPWILFSKSTSIVSGSSHAFQSSLELWRWSEGPKSVSTQIHILISRTARGWTRSDRIPASPFYKGLASPMLSICHPNLNLPGWDQRAVEPRAQSTPWVSPTLPVSMTSWLPRARQIPSHLAE